MKPITLEELSKEPITRRVVEAVRCPMYSCVHKGDYERCYNHTSALCPIYANIYSRLTPEQRRALGQ